MGLSEDQRKQKENYRGLQRVAVEYQQNCDISKYVRKPPKVKNRTIPKVYMENRT